MHYHRLSSTLFIGALSLFCNQFAHAAAFQLYELGTPIVGTADVGQAAIASDASTAYFNPAGMAVLPNTQFMLGSQMILPYMNFSADPTTTIRGSNGGNAGSLIPGIGGFFSYHFSPQLAMGVSLTAPYGGMLNYDDHWVGRYSVQQMTLYTLNLNPVVAYRFNDWLSVGAGFAIEYANLYQSLGLSLIPFLDGQVTIKTDNTAVGYNLGILLTPTAQTKIGVAYRSQIVHHLGGSISLLNLSQTPHVTTKLVMPANVIVSVAQLISDNVTLLGEAGWANWSSMFDTIVTVDGFSAVTPNHWHDTYRVGLGGQYRPNPCLLLQAGVSYDSSPTSSSHRLPNLAMDQQIRVGAGLAYDLIKAVTLGLSYEYINFGKAKIKNTSNYGVLAGDYSRNFGNVLQISLNANLQ